MKTLIKKINSCKRDTNRRKINSRFKRNHFNRRKINSRFKRETILVAKEIIIIILKLAWRWKRALKNIYIQRGVDNWLSAF